MGTGSSQARRRGVLLVSAAGVLWGTLGLAADAAFRYGNVPPVFLSFLRMLVAVPCLGCAAWVLLERPFRWLTRRDLAWICLTGVMLAVSQTLYFMAIPEAGVAVSTMVAICLAPITVAALSTVLGTDRPTRLRAAALAVATAGTALLLYAPEGGQRQGSAGLGIVLAAGSAVFYAGVILMSEREAIAHHPIEAMALAFAAGSALLLPSVLWLGDGVPASGGLLLAVVYMGAVPTSLAYVIFAIGIKLIRPTSASIVSMVDPLTATLLAFLFLGEEIRATAIFGGVALLGAVALLGLEREGAPALAAPRSAPGLDRPSARHGPRADPP